jgi:prolyl 4-hydroxylase
MIYSVICTNTSNNIHWQSELLEYSWSKVKQPGELIRLVSCEAGDDLPEHRYAKVIRTRPTSVHPESGDNYLPYNRLFSFREWLEEYQPDGTILILDPDCVFRKPLNLEVQEGHPMGQRWLDYGVSDAFRDAIVNISDVVVNDLQPLTWPALIHSNDLRKIISRWIALTAGIRDQIARWESDMFAFVVACKEFGLEFELQNHTAWTPWPDARVKEASIVHYCQKIVDNEGRQIWWKQAYQPWDRLQDTTSANQNYCNDLLELVDEFAAIRQFEETLADEDTIFIAIAAYCEPELVTTIESCLTNARRPDRLRFGICLQYDESDPLTSSTSLDQYSQDIRVRYVKYPYTDSRGGCWARNIAQQLYVDERYTLQIDAHSQMLESWDVILIEMLHELPSQKPLITAFPPLYYFSDGARVYEYIDDLSQVNTALAKQWNQDGSIHHPQAIIAENNSAYPRRTRFLSGAFVFTLGIWNEEVRQDPEHFYTGEEFALTLRSFTHGYDLFDPSQIVVWHRLHPMPNRKFWHDNDSNEVQRRHDNALRRLRWLYEGDPENQLGCYGLGPVRGLEDFNVYSGLDCRTYAIHDDARNGVPPNPVTLPHFERAEIMREGGEAQLLDIRIYRKGLDTLELACELDNPILKLLFQSLLDKSSDPDSVIYLNIGENGEQVIRFRKSALVAIETDPPLPESFFAGLNESTVAYLSAEHNAVEGFRFTDEWKYWIWHNIFQRGVSRDVVFKELVLNDFPWESIRDELNYEPTVPLEQLRSFSEQDRPSQDKLLIPNVKRVSDHRVEAYSIDDFLTERECAELVEQIRSRQQPSATVLEDRTPEVRTNKSCFFKRDDQQCPLSNEVTLRVSKLLGINPSYAEPIQGHIYTPNQEYKPHGDYFSPGTDEFDKYANDELGGQRTWSVLLYLNDVEEGGATEFSSIGLSIKPKRGKAVFWNNLHPSGAPNGSTLHHGKPPKSREKFVLTQWFRSIGSGVMFQRDTQEYIPAYTRQGFEKRVIPIDIFHELKSIIDSTRSKSMTKEKGNRLVNPGSEAPADILEIPEPLRESLFNELAPICAQWCGKELLPSAVYGIRRYRRGTSLEVHRDRPKTHIISAILNIAQSVDEDWPLEIEDHAYRTHRISMAPGDMLLYEGGRLPHGRPTPLRGDYYCNVFVHFRPIDYIVPDAIP